MEYADLTIRMFSSIYPGIPPSTGNYKSNKIRWMTYTPPVGPSEKLLNLFDVLKACTVPNIEQVFTTMLTPHIWGGYFWITGSTGYRCIADCASKEVETLIAEVYNRSDKVAFQAWVAAL
jgi:hypothetical protein